ncbi:uncharacterized protein A1O9_06615, partial [Exophiala aquamarina CBS 119918]
KTLFQPLLRANGLPSYYWGRQLGCPDVASAFVNWDSVDHHTRFTATRKFAPILDAVTELIIGPPQLWHIPSEPFPPTPALAASPGQVTETVILYFPAQYDRSSQLRFHNGVQR